MKILRRVVWSLVVVLGIYILGGCGSADKDPQPAAIEESVTADEASGSEEGVTSGGNVKRDYAFQNRATGETVDWVFPNIGKDPSSWQEFAYNETGEMFWAVWDLFADAEFPVKIAEGEYYYQYIPADRTHGVGWGGYVKEGTGGLNLRAEPDTDAEIVKVINDGEMIVGYLESATLILLPNDEEIGWVFKLRNSVTSGDFTWEYATYSDENGNNYTGWVAMEYVEAYAV